MNAITKNAARKIMKCLRQEPWHEIRPDGSFAIEYWVGEMRVFIDVGPGDKIEFHTNIDGVKVQ